jgi:hypothetical protein
LQAHLAGSAARTRGAVMIELALSMSVTLPLLLGVGAIGLRLGRTLQATQVTRDVAHMYALGTDFSLGGSQTIARTLSRDFSLTDTGNAVLLLSRVMKVQQTDCNAAGLSNCPNLNLAVITQRITIGNTTLRTSAFSTPPAGYIGGGGNIAAADYCKQTTLIAANFDAILTLAAGQSSTVVEGYFGMHELNLLAFPGTGGGYYVRFLF